MPPAPAKKPARGTPEWRAMKREEAQQRATRRETKGFGRKRFEAHVERDYRPRTALKRRPNTGVFVFPSNAHQALQKMRRAGFISVIEGRVPGTQFKVKGVEFVFKPRKRLPTQSASMKKKWQEYERAKREWRIERVQIDGYLRCEFMEAHEGRCRHRAMRNPHHRAGRAGKNLADKSKFMAACHQHHVWIDTHRKQAEARGYIIRERQKH